MKVTTRNNLLVGAAAIGASVLMVLFPFAVMIRSLERPFDQFSGAIVHHRYDEAYKQCGSVYRQAMSYDQFVQYYSSLEKQFGPLKSYKRGGLEVTARSFPPLWRGVMDAEFVYEKKTLGFEFVFHKEGDRWVIFRVEEL
jgi:hypothetical protein